VVGLTEKGKEMGKFLLDRHFTVEEFLKNLGVKERLLEQTELIEHNISIETLEKMRKFNRFLKENPEIKEKYQKSNP
jgi:Mn-dependent DtxR family transcriptional regulator